MQLSLRARVVGLLLLSMPLAILAISVAIIQYRTQIAHTERLELAATVATTLDEIFAHVLQASNTSRRFVLSDDPAQLAAYERAIEAIPPALSQLHELTDDQVEFATAFDNLEFRLQDKLAHLDSILQVHAQNEDARLRSVLISGDGLQRLEAYRASVADFRRIDYAVTDDQLQQFRVGTLVQFALVVLLILCGGIWATLLGNETIRNILKPVSSMIAQVQRIAAGDFSASLPSGRRDEVGRLAEQINLMTVKLRDTHDEREQARADLAAEQRNLVDAIEALDEGFAAYDQDGCLLQCNRKFLEYFPAIANIAVSGVPYETLLRERVASGSEPASKGRNEAFIKERLEEAQTPTSTRECGLSDGRILRRSSYRTRNGGRVAVYVDITEIKNAESNLLELNRDLDNRVRRRTDDLNVANEQLQRLNAELNALIVSAPVAIVELTPDRSVTTWNPAAIELTGLGVESVEPGLRNIVDDDNSDAFNQFLDRIYDGEGRANAEFRMHHHNGETIEANVYASVLADDNGEPIGAILIIANLTEARVLQHQFHQSQKMEVVAQLTAGLSHDFNNLLAIVIANIELLESRIPKDDISERMLLAAKQASQSGVVLNRKLLAFSRNQSLEPEGLDLNTEFNSLEPLFQITLGEQIHFRLSLNERLWPVHADRSLLQAAALNLAVNARDAMPGSGELAVSASNVTLSADDDKSGLEGDFVQIDFTDTGEGMSEDIIASAFQPFYTTKDFGKGSGLGLSMVYGFVNQSGGGVEIESEPGSGTCVKILLPRAAITVDESSTFTNNQRRSHGEGETILLVEDNHEMRRATTLQLAELGFEPIQTESGATALELLEAEVPIDLLLTDIVMPGDIDGRELAKRARRLRPDLPIVFISGYPASDDGSEASWESLGIKVLAKPVDKTNLGAHINETIANARVDKTTTDQTRELDHA